MKRLGTWVLVGVCAAGLGAQTAKPSKAEAAAWEKVKASGSAREFEAFLAQFPKGALAALAKAKLVSLKQAEAAAAPADPSKQLVRDKLETREEYAARIAALGPLVVGRGQVSVDTYDIDSRRLVVPFTPEPWATAFFQAGRIVLEVDRDTLKAWLAKGAHAPVVARFEVREGQAQPVEMAVQSPMGLLTPAAEPPPVPGAQRNAGNLWEVTFTAKSLSLDLVQIPAGTFRMGTPGNTGAERAHTVTLSRDFWIGKVPVTVAQWTAVMGAAGRPADANPKWPKTSMSWNDAQMFVERLNWMQSAWTFRLPTEAEWEYACRAGSEGVWYGDVDAIAWHAENSGKAAHPVGEKLPNAFGLHDMLGNVWQWCQDWYGDYPAGEAVDPKGPDAGEQRVNRGGSWNESPQGCRSAIRSKNLLDARFTNVGLRVVATPRQP